MKRSLRLQKKLDELAEKSRLRAQDSYLNKLKSEYGILGKFVPKDAQLYISSKPWEYVCSYEFTKNPLEKFNNFNMGVREVSNRFLAHLKEFVIKGDALFYLSGEAYGGCWLQLNESQLNRLALITIEHADLSQELEFLVGSTESNIVLALFEDEYDYFICKIEVNS